MDFEGSARSEEAPSPGIILKSSQMQFRAGSRCKPRDAQGWDLAITEILNYNNSVYP